MNLVNRVIKNLEKRRNNIISGNINSIPSPFKRFKEDFVGVEQGKYTIITSSTKGGKTQFASYMYIYTPILYAYNNPDILSVKIFYYPLEETKENVIERFMCYLLYVLSNHQIRIAPNDLRSTNNDNPLPEDVLNLLKSEPYQDVLKFFEENVIFSTAKNATGVWKECKTYAEQHGTTHYKKVKVTDEITGEIKEVQGFDYYEPNNPREYRIIFYDHISLTSPERGMDLRQSIVKLSEYFVTLRNRYNYSPIVIQQQAFYENTDAFKLDKLRPSIVNLADAKATARDCNTCLALFSPYKYELKTYLGYDISKFKDNIRFLEVLISRDGPSNGITGIYFDGKVNYFKELPLPSDTTHLSQIYEYLNLIRSKTPKVFLIISNKLKKLWLKL